MDNFDNPTTTFAIFKNWQCGAVPVGTTFETDTTANFNFNFRAFSFGLPEDAATIVMVTGTFGKND